MTNPQRREQILQEMNTLTRMERGKLCLQSRGPGTTPFYKLQSWHQGKNHTRYVPADHVPAVKEALAGHQRFQELALEFGRTNRSLDPPGEAAADRKKTPGGPERTLPRNRSVP